MDENLNGTKLDPKPEEAAQTPETPETEQQTPVEQHVTSDAPQQPESVQTPEPQADGQQAEPPVQDWQVVDAVTQLEQAAAEVAPKRSNMLPIIIIGAIVVIAVIAVLFMSGVFSQSPRKALDEALENTSAALLQQNEMIMALPAFTSSDEPSRTDFTLAIDKLEGSLVDEMQGMGEMVKMFGINGTLIDDMKDGRVEAQGAITANGSEIIRGIFYLSDSEIGVGVPGILPEMLGFNLDTIEQDYKGSDFASYVGDDPETEKAIAAFKDTISQIMNMESSGMEELSKTIQTDMNDISKTLLDDATYTRTASSGATQTIEVKIDGAKVKQYVKDMLHYIYLDSPIGEMYKSMFTAEMTGGMAWEDIVDIIMGQVDSMVPALPTTITYQIADKRIDSMHVDVYMGESTDVPVTIDIDYGDTSYKVNANLDITLEGVPMNFSVKEDADFADGYKTIGNISMGIGNVNVLNCDFSGAFDAAGAMRFDMGMSSAMLEIEDLSFGVEGTIKEDAGKQVVDVPRVSLKADIEGQTLDVNMKITSVTSALDTVPYEPSLPIKNIFKLTEDDRNDITEQFENASDTIMGNLLSALMAA